MSSELREFKLGPLRGIIDPDSGQLRYLRIGPHELLRGIYGSVRRPDWGTVVQKVHDFKLDTKRESFHCSFVAAHKDEKMDFTWAGTITGQVVGDGQIEIEYHLEGTVPSDQMTNRLGLCLLHPASLKGIPAVIDHGGGSNSIIPFPIFIKPDQPFKDTKSISYEVGNSIKFRLELSGDNFETEDQRNYGDASFKTYCHWQESGSPYPVKKGQVISNRAKIIINPSGAAGETAPTETEGELPSLGTLFKRSMTTAEMSTLMSFHFTHAVATTDGLTSAKQGGGPTFLQTQTATVPSELSSNDGILFSPSGQWKKLGDVHGTKKFIQAKGWFIEMNGSRPQFDDIDGAALGLQPKTHQFDTETMMECGWVITDQVASARHLGAKTIMVGPARLSDEPDSRTNGIEAALFALAVVANSVKAKADYVTLFDAETLLKSPAAFVVSMLSDRRSNRVQVWDIDSQFVAIECGHMILANLSWEPSEHFKKLSFDSQENLQVGIKTEYHLLDKDNIANWREVLAGPAKHNVLSALPPRSIVVLG